MKTKQKIKIIVDIVMTVILLFMMSYAHTGQWLHEYLGVTMFIMFGIHKWMNRRWFLTLHKGKYTAYRAFNTGITLLIIGMVILLMISGIVMSRYALPMLSVSSGVSLARKVHLAASYWGFALIAIHLGLHWAMMMGMFKRMFKLSNDSKTRTLVTRILAIVVMAIGAYLFYEHNLLSYLTLSVEFVFFDFEQHIAWFMMEYVFILIFLAGIGYYLGKALRNRTKGKS